MIKRIYAAALVVVAMLANLPPVARAGETTTTSRDYAGSQITWRVGTSPEGYLFSQMRLCDGVAGAYCAAIKAASTAPVVTDPALTVVIRPDNIVQTGSGIVVRCYPPGGGMAASLHAAGTALGNARTCANSFRSAAANSGTLSAVSSTWYIGVTPQITVFLFSRALTTSTCTDNAAVVITDVDLEYMVAQVTLNHESHSALSSGSFGVSRFVQEIASSDSFTSFYMCVVADTAVTPTGGFDNYVGLHIQRH